eukprot:Stramenopile-MAST_4_protein_5486
MCSILQPCALIVRFAVTETASKFSVLDRFSRSDKSCSSKFGSMIVELLDYHSDEAVLQRSLFPKFSESNVAPSVAGNMHISFNVRPEKNLNDFVVALEGSAHERGFDEVLCNRLVPVKKDNATGRPNVKGVPVSDNSFEVTGGAFQGWSLAYCKGPDGEQLEFNQVKGKAKGLFDDALRTYLSGGENKLW